MRLDSKVLLLYHVGETFVVFLRFCRHKARKLRSEMFYVIYFIFVGARKKVLATAVGAAFKRLPSSLAA